MDLVFAFFPFGYRALEHRGYCTVITRNTVDGTCNSCLRLGTHNTDTVHVPYTTDRRRRVVSRSCLLPVRAYILTPETVLCCTKSVVSVQKTIRTYPSVYSLYNTHRGRQPPPDPRPDPLNPQSLHKKNLLTFTRNLFIPGAGARAILCPARAISPEGSNI